MSIIDALKNAEAAREEAISKAREALKPGLMEFMRSHPDVAAIRWTQYSPYFNDGEECVFGVNELEAKSVQVAATAEEEEEDDEDEESSSFTACYGHREKAEGFSAATWKDLVALNKQLQKAEDVLKEAFGNHTRVTVTQKKVSVEEYEHD